VLKDECGPAAKNSSMKNIAAEPTKKPVLKQADAVDSEKR
jgi:hypothetical protein